MRSIRGSRTDIMGLGLLILETPWGTPHEAQHKAQHSLQNTHYPMTRLGQTP